VEEAARLAGQGGRPPAAAIRVNPDVQAGGHPHIATGRHEHKFGLDWNEAKRLYLAHRDSKWIRWRGISAHIGSQITTLVPFRRALGRLAGFAGELRRAQIDLRYLDVGGGLGVRYSDQKPPTRREYARLVSKIVRKLGLHLLLEPGAFDHRFGRCSLDARGVYENEPGKDVCGCRLGDERPDAAGSLRGDPPHYETYAGRKGKGRQPQTCGYCRAGLRDGRLLFAGLAARRSAGRRPACDLGCGSVWNVAGIKL